VRRANPGETLVTLDDKNRTLNAEDLLITDESGPIGLAGVMGGASDRDLGHHHRVLIEAANFDPVSIARTARATSCRAKRPSVSSAASTRSSRRPRPRGSPSFSSSSRVARSTTRLLTVRGVRRRPITLRDGFVSALLGVEYTPEEVRSSLEAIGATVEPLNAGLAVTPPSWRPDLDDEPTLAEEVARLVGYDRIPSVLPVAPPGRGLSREQVLRRVAANMLAANGLTEVQSYPFVSKATHERFSGDAPAMRLANPLDAEVPLLRRSVIPGLLDAARRNLSRGLTELALFEIGTVFLPEPGRRYGSGPLPAGDAHPGDAVLTELNAGIPPQPWHVGAVFLGDRVLRQPGVAALPSSVADAIAAARQLAAGLAVTLRVEQGNHPAYHPGRTAELYAGDRVVGIAGELLPAIADDLDLPRVVALLEIDLDALIDLGATEIAATPISSFPAATQDVSLVVPEEIPAADVLAAVTEGAGALLEHAYLVDDYRGQGIEAGDKSLTFALRFRGPDRTLTAAEASEARLAGVAVAAQRFGATLRE
jgi:phenylalanyl-tRNA synthetase beta chain